MKQLPEAAPYVYNEFMQGNFVVKSSANSFNQIPVDQALEHVNKMGKVSGGLVGITRTDSARERWCLTYNDRTSIAEQTRILMGISSTDEVTHIETGTRQLERDEAELKVCVRYY